MGNYATWDKNQPSDTSQVRDFPSLQRSDKSILQAALNTEHYFNTDSASSLSAGVHRPGSARPFFGAASSISTIAGGGWQLFVNTDTNELVGLSSTSTVVLGASFDPIMNSLFR